MQDTESSFENQESAVRLSKRVAELRSCSRREAELLIENGTVQVDGQVVEIPGARVSAQQSIAVREGAQPQEVPPVTLLLNKPAGYTVGEARRGVRSALELLTPEHLAEVDTPHPLRVLQKHFNLQQPLMALPVPASGLTVFTQDHRVIRKLTADARYLEQECVAKVKGQIDEDGLQRLCDGTAIAGKQLPRAKVSWQNEEHLRFAIKGIWPEEIEAMCAGVGLTLVGLKRLRIGRISMGKLPEGQWRYAMPWEQF